MCLVSERLSLDLNLGQPDPDPLLLTSDSHNEHGHKHRKTTYLEFIRKKEKRVCLGSFLLGLSEVCSPRYLDLLTGQEVNLRLLPTSCHQISSYLLLLGAWPGDQVPLSRENLSTEKCELLVVFNVAP